MIWTVFSGRQALGIVNEHTREQAQRAADERFGWVKDDDSGRYVRRNVKVGRFKKAEIILGPDLEDIGPRLH